MTVNPAVIADLHKGEVIAYPTEAVFGLGCDPDNKQAVMKLLAIKQRPMNKGLILIAADYQQLLPYIDDNQLTSKQKANIQATWPGGTTWVMPASTNTPHWLRGDHSSIAVRVSAHPVVKQLCREFGKPLVSTSANLSGQPAIDNIDTLRHQIGDKVSHIVPGSPDTTLQPSKIIDAVSGIVYRH
jgi:L-threonylcarbamoyladenylate synthase